MVTFPTGTVTFLFTDVESSTALWERHPEAMHRALIRHDALIEAAVAAAGGMVVRPRGEGDSRFAVFARATDAVGAACAIQQALHAEPWPTPTPLRARIALHTGEADLRAGDYYGAAVNRCARLRSSAHGGQTVLSQTTHDLVRGALPPNVRLRDLGEHRLKDVIQPEQIFQLLVSNLPHDFPPLHTLDARPNNLPAQPTPLIGREGEMASVQNLLLDAHARLVTLTGPGGTGKTRLAMEVAAELIEHFADGAWFVALAPVREPALVLPTVAATLGVRESSPGTLADDLASYLRHKHLLLVLDNFEQVVAAAPAVADLLAAAPRLRVVVTSRAVLHLRGERELIVPALPVPDPKQRRDLHVLEYDAVRLFVARAQDVRADFELTPANAATVAEICARLDGLPLAIELAAARSKLLSPPAILARLHPEGARRLNLLVGGARDLPTRHQTLRSTISWSYALLEPSEQQLFRQLAVFVGGCTVEAVETICALDDPCTTDPLDGLQALVDNSLVRQQALLDAEPRFTMLETIREFATEQLEADGTAPALRRRYALYYTTLAEAAEPELTGADQQQWFARLADEHDNVRAAIRWALGQGEPEIGARLAGAIWRFWWVHGHLSEGRRWFDQILAQRAALSPPTLAKVLHGAGGLAHFQGDYADALRFFEERLILEREHENVDGIARALSNIGTVLNAMGEYERAIEYAHESLVLEQQRNNKRGMAFSYGVLADAAYYMGDYGRAQGYYEQALVIERADGDTHSCAITFNNLGEMARLQGNTTAAATWYAESLQLFRQLASDHGIGVVLRNLGDVAAGQGDYARAAALYGESLQIAQKIGEKHGIFNCFEGLAEIALRCGHVERSACLWGAADVGREALSAPRNASDLARCTPCVEEARALLGNEAFFRATQHGRSMSQDQAIAYALQDAV